MAFVDAVKFHVSATQDMPNGKVQVSLQVLLPVELVPEPVLTPAPGKAAVTPVVRIGGPVSPYPGFKVVGQLSLQLSSEEATNLTRGNEFKLASI